MSGLTTRDDDGSERTHGVRARIQRAAGRIKGKRTRFTSNFVRTGGVVDTDNVANDVRYVVLER